MEQHCVYILIKQRCAYMLKIQNSIQIIFQPHIVYIYEQHSAFILMGQQND